MKRMDRVEQLLLRWTAEEFDRAGLVPHRPQGCTAEWTGQTLGIDRSNASRDLNALVSERRASKIGGKPVLFFSCEGLRQSLGWSAEVDVPQEFDSWEEFVKFLELSDVSDEPHRSAFDTLVGSEKSLNKPIELAKAAILYPPHGLHTLLTGPTGVGKTLFAESMYRYAVETGCLPEAAPYVAFNCADYANNPQLLLAHLFGVEKGAYTGADRDRAGLVEKANGGVLFLDEVHRLPPEGQEMLFTLLDRGVFRRLGESEAERQARVRLIAATTEHVQSALLMTFVRRIPMWVPIPSLTERTFQERFDLIQFLFAQERARVQRPFWVAPEVVKALLLFECPANVGQLKSEIQLLCARAFLTQIQAAGTLDVTLEHASDHVREGLLRRCVKWQELDGLLQLVANGLVLNAEDVQAAGPILMQREESVYELLELEADGLRRRGLTEEEISNVLSLDVDVYFRKFLRQVSKQFASRRQEIAQLVGDSFLQVVEEMFDVASHHLDRVFSTQMVFGAALHMHAAAERIRSGLFLQNSGLAHIQTQSPDEYATAQQMLHLFAERTHVSMPESEVGFLATILAAATGETPFPKVGVLVAAHGTGTATSMLETAQQLLGTQHGSALNVSLHIDPIQVTEEAVRLAESINEGKGVLLLVDMGALVHLGEQIEQRTGIPVRTVSFVTTLTVMEAVRKAGFSHSTLQGVYESVLQGRRTQLAQPGPEGAARKIVLPVVCVTGQGSAVQLKAILEERLIVPDEVDLEIVPVAITSFEETHGKLRRWLGGQKPLAIVGTLNPSLEGVPFISAQEVLSGEGVRRLSHLIGISSAPAPKSEAAVPDVWEALLQTFKGTLKRVNPWYVLPLILTALDRLQERWAREIDLDMRIGIVMHLIMALERRLTTGRWPTESRADELGGLDFSDVSYDRDAVTAVMADVGTALEVEIPHYELNHLMNVLVQNFDAET